MSIYEITFSPTGGTKKVAELLTHELGSSVSEIDLTDNNEDFGKYHLTNKDLAVVAVPSYGGRVTETAINRLNQIKGNGASAVAVVVYGNRDYEDTLIELSGDILPALNEVFV